MCKMTGWVFSVVITLAILAAPLSAQMVTEEWVADVPEFQWSATLAPTSVWTGSKLIVLAPPAKTHSNPEQPVTGRIYDLATDSWDLTPNLTTGFGAPNCGQNYSTVWTGSQLIVWGQKMPNKPNEGGIYDLATDSWYMPPNLQGAVDSPLNRKNHAAVWTGTHMIVFGGDVDPDTGIPNSGYMYNPTSDVWENLPNFANAVGVPFNGTPLEQGSHTGIWTGSQFVILGYNGQSIIGGVYNPSTDSWEDTPALSNAVGCPTHQSNDDILKAYWTGSKIVTWSGSVGSGGIYDLDNDSWVPTTEFNGTNAMPCRAAAWTGSKLLVWGDVNANNFGGAYDPSVDTWIALPNFNSGMGAPPGGANATTAWTGANLIVWGGSQGSPATAINTGGIYDLGTDSWVSAQVLNNGWEVPEPRSQYSAVWTGTQLIIWGGYDTNTQTAAITGSTGRVFDRQLKKWSTPPNLASGVGAPPGRKGHAAVWTGSKMIVWGGSASAPPGMFKNDGGIYDPVTDAWESAPNFNAGIGAPLKRTNPIVIWTGNKLFVYGGTTVTTGNSHKGGMYDPATDTWENLPNLNNGVNAPLCDTSINYSWNKGVWTGSQVIIWGKDYHHRGIYTPATDTWEASPEFNSPGAPHPRYLHSAIWTGNDMMVWGGIALEPPSTSGPIIIGGDPPEPTSDPSNNGGRYVPDQDIWLTGGGLYSASGGPGQRYRHTAVWTGETGNPLTEKRMIVWGGVDGLLGGGTKLKSGGVYNSVTNTWQSATPTLTGVPSARDYHSAIWTGTSMIIWGGDSGIDAKGDGRAYDIVTNTWSSPPGLSSGANKPSARFKHSTVCANGKMIVFGGTDYGNGFQDGGIYDPATDTWEAKPNLNAGIGAPLGMMHHAAVWTGTKMIVWGGSNWFSWEKTNTGGIYDPASDTWENLPNFNAGIGAPQARIFPAVVWTGSKLLVWGGELDGDSSGNNIYSNTGGLYDPATDTWELAPNLNAGSGAPTARTYHTMVWDGNKAIVWGGYDDNEHSQTGAVYEPSTDTWNTPGHLGANADVPNTISDQSVMWTGSKLLIWGGYIDGALPLVDILHGYLYDLADNEWEVRPTLNNDTCPLSLPSTMDKLYAVCTGSRMIVWGGNNTPYERVGAVYDLPTDSWLISPNLDTGFRSPVKRGDKTAVFWTGSEMILWGGYSGVNFDNGGIYRYEVAYSAPVLSAIGNKSAYEGEALAFIATANDDDIGDTLTYSLDAAAVALGMTIDPNTGEFAWPVPLHTGLGGTTQYATITVTDSTFNTDSETIEIAIPLGTPVLAAIGSKSIEAGRTLTFTASATDPNPGDTLTYSLDAASVALGMKIDLNTGAFKWTPRLALAGTTVVVTITVTDGAGLTDSETFKIAVTKPPLVRAIKKP